MGNLTNKRADEQGMATHSGVLQGRNCRRNDARHRGVISAERLMQEVEAQIPEELDGHRFRPARLGAVREAAGVAQQPCGGYGFTLHPRRRREGK
jgi:hypothetical protein